MSVRLFTLLGLAAISSSAFLACDGDDTPAQAVSVSLSSYRVEADKTNAKAGKVKFTANNKETRDVHELAVLKVNGPDDFENLGEVEDIDPGKGGDVTIDLKPGKYLLACLIAPGEAGSTVDHFQQGMRLDFTVE
jgi:uncharacterized cupredoxin-like copper-binding protein